MDNRNQKLLTSLVLSAVLFGAVPAFSQAAPQANVNAATVQTQSAPKAPALANEEKEFAAGPHIAEVDVDGGHVQGYVRQGIYTYHGIPYAEAKERFTRASKVTPWQGTRLAQDYGAISPQKESEFPNTTWEQPARKFRMDNNCQNLNIWTPGLDKKARPVMVWLHGGGFEAGSSAETPVYDGANLSREGDVVVVSVNHRLGVLGHLDLSAYGEKYADSANAGIYDLIDALTWIQKNIRAFGGNPQNVTIFGESGGGAKVLTLMDTPRAKGLFEKGIVESCATETMGETFMTSEVSRRVAELTLKNLGLDASAVEKLQTVPYADLVAASDKALQQAGEEFKIVRPLSTEYGLMWEPVVDGSFLPEQPVRMTGSRDIPLLIGNNRTEWESFPEIMNAARSQYDNKNTWSDTEIDKKLTEKYGARKDAIVQEFLKAYPDKKKADALYIDTMIRLPMKHLAENKASQHGAPVYSYMFTWDAPVMGGVFMSYHTAEIPFVFHNIEAGANHIGAGRDAKKLETEMSQAWLNFARTGTPSAKGLPKWEPFTEESGAVMIFDQQPRLVHHHDDKLLELVTAARKK